MNQPVPQQYAMPPGQAPTAPVPPKAGKGTKFAWIAYGCAAVGVLVGIWGFWLAFHWQDRAERAEDEYETVVDQLGLSESDNQELVESQQQLAAEKAAIEDERVALEAEKEQLEEQGRQLSDTLDLVAQVARKYNECSSGYSAVIEDLATDTVTEATVQTANRADAACTEAARLASRLQ